MAEFHRETERLILRDWRDEDLDALAAMGRDPQVMATLGPLMDCWGQGYASEAARAAIAWAREERPGEDVYAITSVINARSRAVMERLGMVHQPALDFDHPRVADDSPLKRHVTYRAAMG